MDILGPLPTTARGNKYILVVGEYFTKWTEAYPMPDVEARTIARYFVNEFICRFGVPEPLHTDQGRNFESTLIREICKLLGIQKTRTTPYHPQSDGMIERFNRTLLNMLSIAVKEEEDDWDLILPTLMLAYRSGVHETTGESPFNLMFGREAQLPIDIIYNLPKETTEFEQCNPAQTLRKRLSTAYARVRSHIAKQQDKQKQYYDTKVHGKEYQIGDKVWLHCPAVPKGRSRKLHRPWQGPFVVVKTIGNNVYRIKNVNSPRQRKVVHFNRLKPYQGKNNHSPTQQLEFDVDGDQNISVWAETDIQQEPVAEKDDVGSTTGIRFKWT